MCTCSAQVSEAFFSLPDRLNTLTMSEQEYAEHTKYTTYVPGEYDQMFQAYENGEDVDEDLLSHLSYLKSLHFAREEKQRKEMESSASGYKTSSLDEVD
jgi:hypothetical protein